MLVCADEGSDTKGAAKISSIALREIVEIGDLAEKSTMRGRSAAKPAFGCLALRKSSARFANLSKLERNFICCQRLGRVSSSALTGAQMHINEVAF